MSINSSGSLLASLLYDIANVSGDQEGFLLGSVVKKITDSPNDNDAQLRKEEYVTNIFSYQPCSKVCCFYDACGKINKEKLKNLLDAKHGEIVGWYKARRNSSLSMSFREKMIHRELLELFPDIVQKTFVFGLLVSSVTSNGSTHSLDKVFSSFDGRKFETIPLTVANLGDTSHTEYQLQASHAYNSRHGYYKAIIDSLSDVAITKKGSFPAVEAVKEMNSSVLAKLEALSREVAESELVLASLGNEVERIRTSIHEKQGFTSEDHQHGTDEKLQQEAGEFQSLIDFEDDRDSVTAGASMSTVPSSELHEDLLALANPMPLQPEKEIPIEPLIPTLAVPASQSSSTNTSATSHGHLAMDLDPFPFLSGIAKTQGEQTASCNATKTGKSGDTEEISALTKNVQNNQKTRWKGGDKPVDTQANQNTKSLKLHKSQPTRAHRKPIEQDETVPSNQVISDSPYF